MELQRSCWSSHFFLLVQPLIQFMALGKMILLFADFFTCSEPKGGRDKAAKDIPCAFAKGLVQ